MSAAATDTLTESTEQVAIGTVTAASASASASSDAPARVTGRVFWDPMCRQRVAMGTVTAALTAACARLFWEQKESCWPPLTTRAGVRREHHMRAGTRTVDLVPQQERRRPGEVNVLHGHRAGPQRGDQDPVTPRAQVRHAGGGPPVLLHVEPLLGALACAVAARVLDALRLPARGQNRQCSGVGASAQWAIFVPCCPTADNIARKATAILLLVYPEVGSGCETPMNS